MPKIILSKEEVVQIIKQKIYDDYADVLGIITPYEIVFNEYNIQWSDYIFEKKSITGIKLEDVQDMVIEQLKAKGEQDAV